MYVYDFENIFVICLYVILDYKVNINLYLQDI